MSKISFLKTTDEDVAAELGITVVAPAFALARNSPELGHEAVEAAGHAAFELVRGRLRRLVLPVGVWGGVG
jgi:hypothetical protein